MILKQIHNLPTGPSFGKIAVAAIVAIGLIVLIKHVTEPVSRVNRFTDSKKRD